VAFAGRDVHLSEQLFALLLFLAERALDSPATVPIRAIEDHVWGVGIHRIASSIREPIRALREALAAGAADDAVRSLIEYKRNPNGYRISLGAEDIVIAG
jgi:DNA-binding winged helix-turn-helix (wHTH) protein